MDNVLFFDIETIPDQRIGAKQRAAERVKIPANYVKPDAIAKYREQNADKQWRNTSLVGTWGEIACVSWALGNGPVSSAYHDEGVDEHLVLSTFQYAVSRDVGTLPETDRMCPVLWCGFNICGFDLRFLWQRHRIRQVPQQLRIPYDARPWAPQVCDLLHEWCGQQTTGHTLTAVCEAFGIPVDDDDIKGADVADAWAQGRIAEIVYHCERDVIRVRELYKLMILAP